MTSSVRPPVSAKEVRRSIGANKADCSIHLTYTERRTRKYVCIYVCLQLVTLLGVILALRNYCRK